jgi:hypothetical protein
MMQRSSGTGWPALIPGWREFSGEQPLSALLRPGGLLIGFFFFDTKERGPPFGLRQGEHHDLLRDGLVLEADAEVTRSVPVFAGRERWRNGAGSWHRDPVCAT